jgi:hypothetical protein
MTFSGISFKLSLSATFLFLNIAVICGQPGYKDSTRTDTVIIQKPPLELVKKVYIPYQSKQSGKFFIQVGMGYALQGIRQTEYVIDSTLLRLQERQQQFSPLLEAGYYSRILRYRIGFSFGKQTVEKYSVTNSSKRIVDYFMVNDTIERYYKKRKNGEIDWMYVIRQRPDSAVTVENYKSERAARQVFSIVQVPLAVSLPVNINKIILHPEIGMVFTRLQPLTQRGDHSQYFDDKLRKNLMFFDPFVSFSAGLELLRDLYFHTRIDYRYNIKPAGYYPRQNHGNTSAAVLISYLF